MFLALDINVISCKKSELSVTYIQRIWKVFEHYCLGTDQNGWNRQKRSDLAENWCTDLLSHGNQSLKLYLVNSHSIWVIFIFEVQFRVPFLGYCTLLYCMVKKHLRVPNDPKCNFIIDPCHKMSRLPNFQTNQTIFSDFSNFFYLFQCQKNQRNPQFSSKSVLLQMGAAHTCPSSPVSRRKNLSGYWDFLWFVWHHTIF